MIMKSRFNTIWFIKNILLTLFVSLLFLGCSDSKKSAGGGDTPPASAVTVVAVDGYIKNAIIKDDAGQVAEYSSSGGKYTFSDSVAYPITLSGGTLEDTDAYFDIALSAQEGQLVISPITTFLENDSTLLEKLTNSNLGASTLSEFAVDYVASNSISLARLSQLLYMVLKDATLTSTFKSSLKSSSPASLNDIFTLLKSDVEATMGSQAFSYKMFISQIEHITGSASEFEAKLKPYKELMNINSPAGIILKTGQTTSYADNDDGYYQKGSARSYKDNGDGTVNDLSTGLLWQKEDSNSTYSFSDAGDYCSALNLGSSSSWRLPSIEELAQLSDKGKNTPAIDVVFTDTQSDSYWSGTSYSEYNDYAWYLHFKFANKGFSDKTQQSHYVRCVSQ